jgi:uncharacterized protein YndB with AHSA1/START domain
MANKTEISALPGGKWELVHVDTDGTEYGFHGFLADHASFEVLHLEDLGEGRTKTVATAVNETVEDRDGMIQSGMEKGVNEGNERLDELLLTL